MKSPSWLEPVVVGQILNSTTREPYANTSFVLKSIWTEGFPGMTQRETVPFTTDDVGKFAVKFSVENSPGFFLYWPDGLREQGHGITSYQLPIGDYPDTVNMGVILAKP